MPIPVQSTIAKIINDRLKHSYNDVHPGLFFNRYLVWSKEWKIEDDDIRNRWEDLKQLISHVPEDIYKTINTKQYNMLNNVKSVNNGGTSYVLKLTTKAPTIIGLGGNSPLENSITLHPLLGIPYIPGSTIKGAMRHYLEEHFCEPEEKTEAQEVIDGFFGCQQKAGRLIVFDSFPTHQLSTCSMRLDIMNNHYQDYYQEKENETPGDYHDPIPIYFLTINENVQFTVYLYLKPFVLTKKQIIPPDRKLLSYLVDPFSLFKDSLEEMGIGAKTNVGYGWINIE